ncbi:hypothetical protein J2X65_002032 [Ancylobacter sp. 3268]|uniref:hypothetical protein n=1 Tax=Ancylobacter sp. 3268 TaxID=2817752 RepID=UPI002863453B|nr:hypothetical protein [Ancylobacter sp. 3268]MDR6952673.1 hypothetical protein [Ancylobacter sp. 3268]
MAKAARSSKGAAAKAAPTNTQRSPSPSAADTPPAATAAGASPEGATPSSSGEGEIPAGVTHAAQPLIEAARAARLDTALELAPPDAPAVHFYPVLSPLRHNRRSYRPDVPEANTIELTEAEAETLVAIGVLGEPTETE